MPNHVQNVLCITGKDYEEVLKTIKGDEDEEDYIDFNKIIPRPKDLDVESGSKEIEAVSIIRKIESSGNTVENYLKEHIEILMDRDSETIVQHIKNYFNYGFTSWYEWSCKKWGTKWNAYFQSCEENIVKFQTAWSTPRPVIEALSRMFPENTFTVDYADEDIGSNCGQYVYVNGNMVDSEHPEGDEATYFACNIWEYNAEQYIRDRDSE